MPAWPRCANKSDDQGSLPMHLETRVLVTGGAGFLGSHLCERLLADGGNVICVDNFFTGAKRNIDHLVDHHRFEFIRHDVTFPLYIELDQIYNLACPSTPIRAFTLNSKIIGGTSIRLARAPVTMKASAVRRRCSSTTGVSTNCRSRSLGSSTPMARACIRTTAAWCQTSLSRRYLGERSPSTVTARRPAPSAMSMT